MKQTEADVQRAIIEALLYDGWMILRVNQGARNDGQYVRFAWWQCLGTDQQDSGISDVIALKNVEYGGGYFKRLLAVEVKAPGKKKNVTAKQQAFLDAVEEHGGISIVADCLEDIEPYLERTEVQ